MLLTLSPLYPQKRVESDMLYSPSAHKFWAKGPEMGSLVILIQEILEFRTGFLQKFRSERVNISLVLQHALVLFLVSLLSLVKHSNFERKCA